MELEIGMYVRLKNGIYKINYFINNVYTQKFTYIDNKGVSNILEKNEVAKASHNIIDLIEVGDLVRIEYYAERYKKRVTRLFEVTYKGGKFINLDNAKCQFMLIDNDWTDNDKELEPIIKSIVTKEMFESMEHKVC